MPLIACPECSREVSSLAAACPGCGCPQSAFPIEVQLGVDATNAPDIPAAGSDNDDVRDASEVEFLDAADKGPQLPRLGSLNVEEPRYSATPSGSVTWKASIKPSAYMSLAGILFVGWLILGESEKERPYFLLFMIVVGVIGSIVGVASTIARRRTWVHWTGWMLYSGIIAPLIILLVHAFFLYSALESQIGRVGPPSTPTVFYEWSGASIGLVACLFPAFRKSWLIRDLPAGKFEWRQVLIFLSLLFVSGLIAYRFSEQEPDRSSSFSSQAGLGEARSSKLSSKGERELTEYLDCVKDWNRLSGEVIRDYLDTSVSGELFLDKHEATLIELGEVVRDQMDAAVAVSFDSEVKNLLIDLAGLRAQKLRLLEKVFVCIREGDSEGLQSAWAMIDEIASRDLDLGLKLRPALIKWDW
jgi:hypothetical protein